MNNLDIATGDLSTLKSGSSVYASTGTVDTLAVKQQAPPEPSPICYLYSFQSTCTKEQQAAVLNKQAVIKDWTVVDIKTKGSGNGNGTGNGNGGGSGSAPKKNDAGAIRFVSRSVSLALALAVIFEVLV
jgi:hypothetical protein